MDVQTILLDIESQRDFFDPLGACYKPHSLTVARHIYRLFDWAKRRHVPVISTLLRLPRNGPGPFGPTPHCLVGTYGEEKLPLTVLPNRINLGLRNVTDLPRDILEAYRQIIVEKRHTDIFAHARLERLITELGPTTFVVCGAGLGQGIAEAVIGLRSRGFAVVVAEDAVLDVEAPGQHLATERMTAKGAVFLPTHDIVAPKPEPAHTLRSALARRHVSNGAA
ncbi:MAG: cysteine hydrolase family protein [Planctomycetota bacterium]|jgi:nicotinamidase-related amidase